MSTTTQTWRDWRREFLASELDFIRQHGIWTWEQYRTVKRTGRPIVGTTRDRRALWCTLAARRVRDFPYVLTSSDVAYANFLMGGSSHPDPTKSITHVFRALRDFPGVEHRAGKES